MQRLRLALRFPTTRIWFRAAILLGPGATLIAICAFATGLAHVHPAPLSWHSLRVALMLVVIPAFGEELVFRGLLLPPHGRAVSPSFAVFAVALFVAWHPFQALTFGRPWAAIFLDPIFLVIVTGLGVTLVSIYRLAGSIWPCVAAHWVIVASWKLIFGGPF